MTLNADVRKFFAYLKTFKRRFFGRDELTLSGFISIYLNYDTDYNPFRAAILSCSTKLEKDITEDCLRFVKDSIEEKAKKKVLGKGINVTKLLEKVLLDVMNQDTKNLHDFMYYVLNCEIAHNLIVSYFETVFDVEFKEVMIYVEEYYDKILHEKSEEELHIPNELSKYAKVVDGKREDYKLFTEDDCKDNIWGTFSKFESNNLIVIADHCNFVQKLFYNMAYEVSHDISCTTRKEVYILEVDVQKIFLDGCCEEEYVQELQKVVKVLISLKEKNKLIVYLKNFNIMLKNRSDGFSYVFYTYPLFLDEELKVCIEMDENELKSICTNNRFTEFFEFIIVPPPTKEEIVPYMLGQITALSLYHGVYADGDNIEKTLQYVRAMNYGDNVNGVKNLLDCVMVIANGDGRIKLLENDFIEYFKMNFHEQEKQTDEYKKLIAFHEAGHFVVSRFCKYYKAIYSDLISVISVSDVGGVNIMEYDNSLIGRFDYNFYLECLAVYLAGRASEEIFLDGISAGAVSDLEYATEIATAMIANMGLDKASKIKGNENMNSEKSMNEVSDKVNKILNEAYELAIEQLTEHSEYVKTLAEKLMERKIISRKEILELEVKEGDIISLK